jgi:hypothetical protein
MSCATITLVCKANGPLTKHIYLDANGRIVSDGSACKMSSGSAERIRIRNTSELAALIANLGADQALALGTLRPGLPDHVEVATKRKLAAVNGTPRPDLIARTGDAIRYAPQQPAYALLDYDTKGMPAEIAAKIEQVGGFSRALVSVLAVLNEIACIERCSTSSGLFHTETRKRLPGSGGVHLYLAVEDGYDIERFLTTLHHCCWLAGFGWLMVGAAGQLLERSIVDRMVGAPEGLVFEGPPVVDPPLAQDPEIRRPVVRDGVALDTVAACPPLTLVERTRLKELRTKEAQRLKPEAARVRKVYIAERAARLAARTGISSEHAAQVIARQCEGMLLPHVELPFDDEELAGATVADVLADPEKFEGATLADPLEGPEYGWGKAKILLRADGTPWIHSFAHGRTVYELRHDAEAVRRAIDNASPEQVTDVFVRHALNADLDPIALGTLLGRAADRAGGISKRAIGQKLKATREQDQKAREREEDDRRAAERRDPRPQIPAPGKNAPWLPQMDVINEVLSASRAVEPPMRDLNGHVVQVRNRWVQNLHLLTASGANQEEETRLPAPEQLLLEQLEEIKLAELIERHIDYVEHGCSVHLPGQFVKHYLRRHDGMLPIVSCVATLPMVLPDGSILSGQGLDRQRGIVFRVPAELEALLPRLEECTPSAAAHAMRFLTDEWLCDVATDYTGKCIIIAMALTVIQRLLLPERPAFMFTAGQRGTGKTTLLHMVSMAVLGVSAVAAAWSEVAEERRKALLAYFMEGVPLIAWDNIPRGAAISCPSIEKALTSEEYSDRILGLSKIAPVFANTIQAFTGNNITGRGDLASRVLRILLTADRPDPENRPFRHIDPIGWTRAHRGQILRELYVLLLANPYLRGNAPPEGGTRFKTWQQLIGLSIECAALAHAEHVCALAFDACPSCPASPVDFRALFLAGEAEDEHTDGLATLLEFMRQRWPYGTTAREVSVYASAAEEGAFAFKAVLEQASGKAIKLITPVSIALRLTALKDAPVQAGSEVLVLRYRPNRRDGGTFSVSSL